MSASEFIRLTKGSLQWMFHVGLQATVRVIPLVLDVWVKEH